MEMYDQQKANDFVFRAENISKTHERDEAFKIICAEIDACEDRYLNDYIIGLNYIRHEKVLDWIEANTHRINNVGENWGHLAAISYFSWEKADQWLSKGRPLSLIALDALIFCTTIDERLNQSLWMREINPRLIDNPRIDVIANRLEKYLLIDNVPRTRSSVRTIIKNIFDT